MNPDNQGLIKFLLFQLQTEEDEGKRNNIQQRIDWLKKPQKRVDK